ncbi:hypothetical protein GCM10011380_06000 [Sphingomonas metalli]|uniref:Alpha/beta hydrolase n=1 Tax=Sphingomonas metalli TaxID=1779358 RepID=A0A916SUZ2_9SPHN|nr:alpha/beta hydrolase [Sphingomonas metalli]GGB19209.1 hypothetical protein GCM10011380_06000 [Sphingomonas metalli]
MDGLALIPDRVALISLLGEGQSPLLPDLLRTPSFHDVVRVPQRPTQTQRNLLAAQIDAATLQADRAVMLVAQGIGCLAAAWWARLSPNFYVRRVAGAVMIAPGGAGFASPEGRLPFPSVVVGTDDLTQRLGDEWGSRFIDGPLLVGRQGPSRRFASLIDRFTSAIVERDVAAAERLLSAVGDRC